jgi:inosine-uridine nucleoside N-ribohydrolase
MIQEAKQRIAAIFVSPKGEHLTPTHTELSTMSRHFPSLLLTLLLGTVGISTAQQPVVFDTDYGSFIDDVFALGLLRNSEDLLDLKMILTTAENTTLSAKCVAKHLDQAGRFGDIPVGLGSTLPPYEERANVCGIPGLVGFALESECVDVDLPLVEDGLAALNDMILASDRDDWWYIAVGGQTSLRDFIQQYPEAAAKLDTLVVMGGNWCAGFDPYPGVTAPTGTLLWNKIPMLLLFYSHHSIYSLTDETNIGCDPMAANDVLESDTTQFTKIYYVPVEMADVIGNEDYSLIVQAAEAPPDSES